MSYDELFVTVANVAWFGFFVGVGYYLASRLTR